MQGIPHEITVSEKENRGQVDVALGGALTIKLEASPGTGYSWQIARNNDAVLKPMGESIFEPIIDKRSGTLGAPAYQLFRFSARSSGTDFIEMHYIRAWEKKAKPLQTFCITVHVSLK
jgi:predicted secreted protein